MSEDIYVSSDIGTRDVGSFVLAFVITQLVEVPIYTFALRGPTGGGWRRRAAIGFGASLITHPIVWFLMPRVTGLLYVLTLHRSGARVSGVEWLLLYGVLAEGFAVIVEALYLKRFGVRRALLWSLFANGASVVIGTLAVRLL